MGTGLKKKSPPHKRNRVETAGVTVPGKSEKASPLAAYQFKPGNNANPAGRPRTADLKAAVREFADEADPKIRKTRLRVWLEICDRRARQGSPKHLEMLLAYGWGRPTTPLEHSGGIDLSKVLEEARRRSPLPEEMPTDGSSDAQTAPVATATEEQDSAREIPEQPAIKPKRIIVM